MRLKHQHVLIGFEGCCY